MKKNSCTTLLVFIMLFSTLIKAENDGDDGYDISPPDITDLRLPMYSEVSDLYGERPKEWNVRSINIGGAIYEFDKEGNVISYLGKKTFPDGKPIKGYLIELYSSYDNKPIWKGDQIVYYWAINPDNPKTFPLLAHGFIKSFYTDVVCATQIVAEGYSQKKGSYGYNNDTIYYFNGDCDKAIDKVVNGRQYKTYPANNKIVPEKEIYWAVQYFSDPITPMYDQNNNCVLYCDINEVKK